MKGGIDFDEAKIRRQAERAAKRLYAFGEGILLSEQERLKDRMIELAPVGETHQLRDNIYVEVIRRPSGPVLKCGVKDVAYAVFVEFGTEDTPEQAFLRPALAEMPGYIKRRARR